MSWAQRQARQLPVVASCVMLQLLLVLSYIYGKKYKQSVDILGDST